MSGYKNKGDILRGEGRRGELHVGNSEINFAVPDKHNLTESMSTYNF